MITAIVWLCASIMWVAIYGLMNMTAPVRDAYFLPSIWLFGAMAGASFVVAVIATAEINNR